MAAERYQLKKEPTALVVTLKDQLVRLRKAKVACEREGNSKRQSF
jgi:hypothetical protein